MKLAAPVLLAAFAATPAILAAQSATFTDPANLRGERVSARTGRELPVDTGASGLTQLLRKLNTRASLMLIVAHPDDEDGGMLTYVSRGLGARVAVLTLNRGEGGQNAMTGDFEDALGLLRTQELLSADRYFGVDQLFGTEVDFGFSKTKEEAFAKWTHERVLYDAVRAIRLYRPMVIASVFIGGVTDGHGQHQVSGQIAQEAFLAAADPTVFPDMISEGILPWQAQRVYARVPMQSITPQGLFDYATGQYTPARFTNYVTGEVTTTAPSADVIVHEGLTDPLLTNAAGNHPAPEGVDANTFADTPLSYVQFARIGLGLQRSQIGPGFRSAPKGAFDIAYHLYGSAPAPTLGPSATVPTDPTFFTGLDTSFSSIASLAPDAPPTLPKELLMLDEEMKEAMHWNDDDRSARNGIPDLLASVLKRVDFTITIIEKTDLPADQKFNLLHELRIKRVQLNDALSDAFGLYISADNSGTIQTAGQPLHLFQKPHLVQSAPGKLTFLGGWSRNSANEGLPSRRLPEARNFGLGHPIDFSCDLPPQLTPITRPYFLRDNIEQPVYRLLNPALRNAPATPPALTCWAQLDYQGAQIQIAAVTIESFVPAVNPRLYDRAIVLPITSTSFPMRTSVEPQTVATRPLTFDLPAGWKSTPTQSLGTFVQFRVDATPAPTDPITLHATAALVDGSASFTETFTPVCYPGIPCTNYFTPATLRVVPVDLKLPAEAHRTRIAYIPGTGDSVIPALISLGITPHVLSLESRNGQPAELMEGMQPANLTNYDTIILGVRTYAAHPELHGALNAALLDYARNGGNVLVQYQTPEFTDADAPFPLSLGSNEKVVDETAPVQLLAADHLPSDSDPTKESTDPAPVNALLTTPNLITPADFDNWNEERGHGFLATWDDHYTALTETHDPGSATEAIAPQAPQRGGLITTSLGKGRWTYCAFALYRQLPEAVPGAFRIFMNLINP